MSLNSEQWLELIEKLPVREPIRIMNVCGGHERSISHAGLRSVLPEQVELIPGPGCPVCVCPEEDIYEAIQIALHEDVTLLTFGDMLRVPVNVSKSEARSLEQAKTMGADIRPIASPLDVVEFAMTHPERIVIFFAAGFETTMAPVAAMIAQGMPDNVFLLLSGRLTWPAVSMLLDSETRKGFDCLVAPGHVATVMGAKEWNFVADQHQLPVAVAGFGTESLLAAFYTVIKQKLEGKAYLKNCYPEVVTIDGNTHAQDILSKTMCVNDANWRGIGVIPGSGFQLSGPYRKQDARLRYPNYTNRLRKRAGMMPPGCDCAKVVLGQIYPDQCTLYGKACTPRQPIGPCMVSDEGACRIWWTNKSTSNSRYKKEQIALTI